MQRLEDDEIQVQELEVLSLLTVQCKVGPSYGPAWIRTFTTHEKFNLQGWFTTSQSFLKPCSYFVFFPCDLTI